MFIINRLVIVGIFLVTGCGSINKTELLSHDPHKAITEVEKLRDRLQISQVDLLASDHFHKGNVLLDDAIREFNGYGDTIDILDKLSQSKSHFIEANMVANSRGIIPQKVLVAREAAVVNGARQNDEYRQRLINIDQLLNHKTNNFSKLLDIEDLYEFEKSYLKLEVDSVKSKELGPFRSILENARKNDAKKNAKRSYQDAMVMLGTAEGMIEQSPRDPESYRACIVALDRSVRLLDDVMNQLNVSASVISETAALQLVYEERRDLIVSTRKSHSQGRVISSQVRSGDNNSQDIEVESDEVLIFSNKSFD